MGRKELELLTRAFGQGIVVTPVQLVAAIAALANKGILMKPHVVFGTASADTKVMNMNRKKCAV